jgi:hypothetical protein
VFCGIFTSNKDRKLNPYEDDKSVLISPENLWAGFGSGKKGVKYLSSRYLWNPDSGDRNKYIFCQSQMLNPAGDDRSDMFFNQFRPLNPDEGGRSDISYFLLLHWLIQQKPIQMIVLSPVEFL